MKPLFVALWASLIVLSGIVAVPASHAEAHSGYWRNTGGGLHLRSGPGGAYDVIGSVPSRAVVKAYGHRGNWLKLRVVTSGQVGWAWLWNFDPSSYVPPAPDPPATGGGSTSGGGQICLTNYWSEFVCSSADTGNAIRYWANAYGIGWYWLAATAACESSFHLYVVNYEGGADPPSGLFQFRSQTFFAWGGQDLWSAWDQSRIAAKMFANGAANQYFCAILIGYA